MVNKRSKRHGTSRVTLDVHVKHNMTPLHTREDGHGRGNRDGPRRQRCRGTGALTRGASRPRLVSVAASRKGGSQLFVL